MRKCEFVFLLNILAFIPASILGQYSSEGFRVVQIVTILFALLFSDPVQYDKKLFRVVVLILFLYTCVSVMSELFHETSSFLALLRLVLHFLYILSLFVVLSSVRTKLYIYSVCFLLFIYVFDFVRYLSFINIDISLLSSNIVDSRLIKNAKYDLLDNGYALSSIHVIPMLLFMVLPYLRKLWMCILSICVFVFVVYSFTFTVILAFVVSVFMLFLSYYCKLILKPIYFFYIFGVSLFLILYFSFVFPSETYQLTTGRSLLWFHALLSFVENPLTGISMDEFYSTIFQSFNSLELASFVHYEVATFDFISGGCHNMYLNVLMNKGLIAFVLYMFYLYIIWSNAVNKCTNIIWLLPFIYILIRGMAEVSGIIEMSNGKLEYLFDIYIIYLLSKNKV